jgi:hypothetical protein
MSLIATKPEYKKEESLRIGNSLNVDLNIATSLFDDTLSTQQCVKSELPLQTSDETQMDNAEEFDENAPRTSAELMTENMVRDLIEDTDDECCTHEQTTSTGRHTVIVL